ncbi:MAG TPA: hypothetical protein VGV93_08140 [Acidimicrobiales bacterium]|nr:hypothetical protein [Acidimicrobiales bacterium]
MIGRLTVRFDQKTATAAGQKERHLGVAQRDGKVTMMRRTPQRRLALTLFALVALTVSVAACGEDDAATGTKADATDRAAFCADAPDPSVEFPESYVGSSEHVEHLRQLRSQAPTELREDLDFITTHFGNTVDPSAPDSQLTENFPEDVNAAIARVTAYIDENCVE